jgi:hypothetical protein
VYVKILLPAAALTPQDTTTQQTVVVPVQVRDEDGLETLDAVGLHALLENQHEGVADFRQTAPCVDQHTLLARAHQKTICTVHGEEA